MQAMQIYLARNNVQAGPYSLEQVNTMLASGEVHLDDLAWHDGLDNWMQVGELTNGQSFYDPTGELTKQTATNSTKNKPTVIVIDATKKGMEKNQLKNLNDNQPQDKNRLTVDQLYGRKPVEKNNEPENSNLEKSQQEQQVIRVEIGNQPQIAGNTLATIGTRIFAVFIDQLTLSMLFLPLWLNADTEKLSEASTSYEMMNQLVASAPQHIIIMVMIFALAFLFIQIFLLITKGQTLGKLVTGIRILDMQTNQVPPLTNLLLIRTIGTQILYGLPLIGIFVLASDFFMMVTNPQRRSLHDRFAKTYVAKANPTQLKEKEAKKIEKE